MKNYNDVEIENTQYRINSGREIAENERRTFVQKMRLNKVEKSFLEQSAKIWGVTKAEFLRMRLLQTLPSPIPEMNIQYKLSFSKIGVNLNQLVRHAHETQLPQIAEIQKVLDELSAVCLKMKGD